MNHIILGLSGLALSAILGGTAWAQSLSPLPSDKAAVLDRINKAVAQADAERFSQQTTQDGTALQRDMKDFETRKREALNNGYTIVWDRVYGTYKLTDEIVGLFFDGNDGLIIAGTQSDLDKNFKCMKQYCGPAYARLTRTRRDGSQPDIISNLRITDQGRSLITQMNAAAQLQDGGFVLGVSVVPNEASPGVSSPFLPRAIKLDRRGNLEWEVDFPPESGQKYNKISSVLPLKNGDILVVVIKEDIGGHPKAFISRLNKDGKILWEHAAQDAGFSFRAPIETQDGGLIFDTSKGFLKLNASGQTVWTNTEFYGIMAENPDGTLIVIGNNGEKYVGELGRFHRDPDHAINTRYQLGYATIAGLDANGKALWSKDDFGIESYHGATFKQIIRDTSGDFFIVGHSMGIVGTDAFLMRISPKGQRRWIQYLPNIDSVKDEAQTLKIASNGDIFIGGLTNGYTLNNPLPPPVNYEFESRLSVWRVMKLEANP